MSSTPRRRLTDLSASECRSFAESVGEKPFRGSQVWDWVMAKGIRDPDEMTTLPASFRSALKEAFDCTPLVARWSRDPGSTTDKLFLSLPRKLGQAARSEDGVEAVLIMEGKRTTACISSQLGCPVGCTFCASGLLGLERNLTRGEIVEQFLEVRARAQEHGRRLGNIVMMGMGEPLLNYQALIGALDTFNDQKGGGIGARHITISTVGVSKGIERLKDEGKQYTLAFSLHAPNDELRRELIPFAGAIGIEEMIDQARSYLDDTGREVTFEYVLLRGVNDRREHASELVHRLRGVRGTVNLIPYNVNPGLSFDRPSDFEVDRFTEALRRGGLKVSVRKRKGHKILAACGQLRLQERTPSES